MGRELQVPVSRVVFHSSYSPGGPSNISQITASNLEKKDNERHQSSTLEVLNVNIVSIVIGALAFIVVIAVVEFIKALCRGVMEVCECGHSGDCRCCKHRYDAAYRKGWIMVVAGLSSTFVCILVYQQYKAYQNRIGTQPK